MTTSCQTYEGGMGGEPGNEAHGGYTFCALSALNILNELHKIDVPRLVEWVVNRQMKVEVLSVSFLLFECYR